MLGFALPAANSSLFYLLDRRQVAIPIGAVTGFVDGVQLSITKQQVENLPPVNTDQPGG